MLSRSSCVIIKQVLTDAPQHRLIEAVLLENNELKPCEPRSQERHDASSCLADKGQYMSNIERKEPRAFINLEVQ